MVGHVVMPEHVHLLISEPERGSLALALQMLKQGVSRRLPGGSQTRFWQPRYYDFNTWSERKRVEKLRYLHRNPVTRGLVASPEQWAWSSFGHYSTGEDGVVEIESQWTARKRERMGIYPTVRRRESGIKAPAFANCAKGRATRRDLAKKLTAKKPIGCLLGACSGDNRWALLLPAHSNVFRRTITRSEPVCRAKVSGSPAKFLSARKLLT